MSDKHCPKCNRRVQPVAFSGEEIKYIISATDPQKNTTKLMKFCTAHCLIAYDSIMGYLANGSGKYTNSIYNEDNS